MILGGGRWSKTICKVLLGLSDAPFKVHMVSPSNTEGLRMWLEDERKSGGSLETRVAIWSHPEELLHDPSIDIAIVANAPAAHYASTKKLLIHEKHVLVEKPFVLRSDHAKELIRMAESRNLTLAVGLEFMMAGYVKQFKRFARKFATKLERIDCFWQDPQKDVRWGFVKQFDLTTNVLIDLLPHVISILNVALGYRKIAVKKVSLQKGGLEAELDMNYGVCPASLAVSRAASEPLRAIRLHSQQGTLCLDFTEEPGAITLNDHPLRWDPQWDQRPRPLQAEFLHFLEAVRQKRSAVFSACRMIHIIQTTEEVNAMVTHRHVELLRNHLFAKTPSATKEEAVVALREHLTSPLWKHKLIHDPKDTAEIDRWCHVALQIVQEMAENPFLSQQEILSKLRLRVDELIELNAVIRESSILQDIITTYGLGAKYWQNTIIPLCQSGAVSAVQNNQYRYPFRIGIYPGLSCMFFCSFCGRNHNARYDRAASEYGDQCFRDLFVRAPKDDPNRFYISGGLEPLTNPHIGDIVRFGSKQGFKLSMYTNGFMLTPRFLEKQDGLWDLNLLRISLYGVDQDTTTCVTKNIKAFRQVINNAKALLRMRNERKSPMKIGFNFVILSGQSKQVLQVLELIAEMNREAGLERQIDFLTLREDYSVTEENGIQHEERACMIDTFERTLVRTEKEDLSELLIDFGYSLNPIMQGRVGRALEMVTFDKMRGGAYPQISIVIDSLGDVYAYREAGFLDRPGAHRYIIGRVSPSCSLEMVVRNFLEKKRKFVAEPGDTQFFDIFDHVVTMLLNQADADRSTGIPFALGPVKARVPLAHTAYKTMSATLAHPTLAHPTLVPSTAEGV